MIGILDFGLGNIASVSNMLKRIGEKSLICKNKTDLSLADKMILPGVGSFDNAINKIHKSGLLPEIEKKVLKEKAPILGICLGMQLLMQKSEEGSKKGLGWVPGEVIKINDEQINVPHMGWNSVKVKRINSLIKNIDHKFRFYFIHSYIVKLQDKKNELLETEYGKKFTSSFAYKNFFGVQFHPEKSHKYGMKILKNFSNI